MGDGPACISSNEEQRGLQTGAASWGMDLHALVAMRNRGGYKQERHHGGWTCMH